jgi:hypothetical protein
MSMNRIEMYASSRHLTVGLQRVLAVSHALARPLREKENSTWWSALFDDAEQAGGRAHALGIESLARIYARQEVRDLVDEARVALALPALDHAALHVAFRAAVISGRAHRAHQGRDVYGASNKRVWDLACSDFGRSVGARYGPGLGEEPISGETGPTPETLRLVRDLVAFDTTPAGTGHGACAEWIRARLQEIGFTVEMLRHPGAQPLLVARRSNRGLRGEVVLYGHYDVTAASDESRWVHPPHELTFVDGRLFARGVADNKGPLAARLAALRAMDATPGLTWLIQGEEETGSRAAHALLPHIMGSLQPDLWLEETGYHDHEDGTLRLLARTIGADASSLAPDGALRDLMTGLAALASRWGVGARHERRGLNKDVVAGGCPFNRNLPAGARYLSIGVNDSRAGIHAPNESLPAWTFALHHAELDVVFRWADRVARGGS